MQIREIMNGSIILFGSSHLLCCCLLYRFAHLSKKTVKRCLHKCLLQVTPFMYMSLNLRFYRWLYLWFIVLYILHKSKFSCIMGFCSNYRWRLGERFRKEFFSSCSEIENFFFVLFVVSCFICLLFPTSLYLQRQAFKSQHWICQFLYLPTRE